MNWAVNCFALCLQPIKTEGPLAEWLGKALQKLLQRFESARDLSNRSESPQISVCGDFYFNQVYR